MSTQVEKRSHRVADAINSGRLEGQEPSPEFLADAEAYVEGRIDDDEFIARGRRRWGLD